MHVVIIDASGSVDDELLDAGTEFYKELLNEECPFNRTESCSVLVWTNVDRHGHRLPLERAIGAYRQMNPHCVIHFITDGYVTDEEVSHVDRLYVYEPTAHSMLHVSRRRVMALVPVPYQEGFYAALKRESVLDVDPLADTVPASGVTWAGDLAKSTHEGQAILLDPMKDIRELAEKAMALVTDEAKYKEHRERIYELFPQLKELEQRFQEFDKRMEADKKKWAEENPEQAACDHGVTFDYETAKNLDANQVRKRWPRLMGPCPKGCGFDGIGYASYAHYICGDW